MVSSRVLRPTPTIVAVAVVPRPSEIATASPTRNRCTVAAWWPSGPPSTARSPSGRASTRNTGTLTSGSLAKPPTASVTVERLSHPGEEPTLLGQLGDLLAASPGEFAQQSLLLG